MRNFPRTFWRSKGQENKHIVFSGDCSQVQQLLTTAFDGEATGEALVQAQRHLAECSDCAQSWAQWEKTRIYLRSVPVPDVPASLLTRILLACRLVPMQNSDFSPFSDSSAHTKLVQYLDAIEDESTIASLSHIMTPVAVPSDLHRRILQATCEAPTSRSFSLAVLLRQWMPVAPASRNAVRWGMGLAVPAMALWFVMAGQVENSTEFAQNLSQENESQQATSSNDRPVKVPTIIAGAKPVLKPLVKQAAAAVKALPRIAPVAVAPQMADLTENRPVLRRVADAGSLPDFERREPRTTSMAARPVSPKSPSQRVRPRTRPSTNLIENRSSGFVLASSRRPISRLPLQATPQISHPSVASAPRLARISESDFDEAFIAVTTARDNRPAEFGLVLDEYRAALLSDTVNAEEETEEL